MVARPSPAATESPTAIGREFHDKHRERFGDLFDDPVPLEYSDTLPDSLDWTNPRWKEMSASNAAKSEPRDTGWTDIRKGAESDIQKRVVKKPRKVLNEKAAIIIRKHLLDQVLENLEAIKDHAQTPSAAAYASELLSKMRIMRDRLPYDRVTEILMAFYDALAYDNRWASYSRDQYERALLMVRRVAKIKRPNDKHLQKSIMELERIGFDTLPYEISLADRDE